MKDEIAGREMKSTIQPSLARPMKAMIAPSMMANEDAMTLSETPGKLGAAAVITFPVTVERTATGYEQETMLANEVHIIQ